MERRPKLFADEYAALIERNRSPLCRRRDRPCSTGRPAACAYAFGLRARCAELGVKQCREEKQKDERLQHGKRSWTVYLCFGMDCSCPRSYIAHYITRHNGHFWRNRTSAIYSNRP